MQPQNRKPSRFKLHCNSPHADGLLAWYPFTFSASSTAYDLAQGRHGTLKNDTSGYDPDQWLIDRQRGGYVLNFRSDDYVEVGAYDQLDVTNVRTVAAWVKADPPGTGSTVDLTIASKHITGANAPTEAGWRLYIQADPGTSTEELRLEIIRDDGLSVIANYAQDFEDGWHHVAATWATVGTAKGQIYIDGVLVDESPSTSDGDHSSGTAKFLIGAREQNQTSSPPITDMFLGRIDDVRLYDRVLSDQEIYSLYLNRWELYEPLFYHPAILAITSDFIIRSDDGILFMPF